MDLRPRISKYGIIFSFTDTSAEEQSYEIVRADSTDSIDQGSIVVAIPYNLQGCGRDFSSVTFADQEAAENPGIVYVYGVRALEMKDNGKQVSLTTVTSFRVPFYATLAIEIESSSGDSVSDTLVRACHILQEPDGDGELPTSSHCWEGRTGPHGTVDFQIEVADPAWTSRRQWFFVAPVPESLLPECEAVAEAGGGSDRGATDPENLMSVFSPANKTIAIEHFGSQTMIFADESAAMVTGEIVFASELVNNVRCPIAGATVKVMKGGTTEDYTTDSAGRFSFSSSNSEVVRVEVSFGSHTFEDDGVQTFVMGVSARSIIFFSNTQRTLSLSLTDEGDRYPYTGDAVSWKVGTAMCDGRFSIDGLTGNVTRQVPALNYTVEMTDAPEMNLQTQSDGPGTMGVPQHVKCADTISVPIIEFFTDLGNLQREADLTSADASMRYVYRTGICLLDTTGQLFRLPATGADTCLVDNNYVAYDQGQKMLLGLSVFEQSQLGDSGVGSQPLSNIPMHANISSFLPALLPLACRSPTRWQCRAQSVGKRT
jgi:hypothetical protein